jgi:hypothetical protein
MPTAERVRSLFDYLPTGHLVWRKPWRAAMTGIPVGSRAGLAGRLQVEVDGRAHYVHRLIWLWHHGEWPADQIDHINGRNTDNRIENLRVLPNALNVQNRHHRGVTFEKRNSRWRARIMVDGKSISLGYFDTEPEALA